MRAWLRMFLLVSGGLVAVSLLFSLFLVPTTKDRALMHFRDSQFDEAKALYESLYKDGDTSPDVIIPLAKLYLQFGDVDGAIRLMEQFVQQNPLHLEARLQLGTFYQYAQRPLDYLRNLEELQRLFPSAETLREMADIYNYYGRYDEQRQALEALVANYEYSQQDVLQLSYLKAREHEYNAAASIITDLGDPKALTLQTVDMAVSLMLDAGESKAAMTFAQNYLSSHLDEIDSALSLAGRLKEKGYPEEARTLLEPFLSNRIYLKAPWLEKVVDIRIAAGESKAVFEKLSYLFDEKILPERMAGTFMELAVEQKQWDMGLRILQRYPLSTFVDENLLAVMGNLLQEKQMSLLQQLNARLDTAVRAQRPVLAAAIDVALGRGSSEASIATIVPHYKSLGIETKILFARLMYQTHHKEALATLVNNIVSSPDSRNYIEDIAQVYLALHDLEGGEKWLSAQRVALASDTNRMNRLGKVALLFDVAQGRIQKIKDWLKGDASHNLNELREMYLTAFDYGQGKLMLSLATAMFDKVQDKQNRTYLVEAYMVQHDYKNALPHLRILQEEGIHEVEGSYLIALLEMMKSDRSLGEELSSFLSALLVHPALMPERRREIAHILLDHGYKDQAEKEFFTLAQDAKPDDPIVGQLLYLWGPRPDENAIAWLLERSESADSDEERAAWLEHLLYAGEAKKIIASLEKERAQFTPHVSDVYLQALQLEGKKERITETIGAILKYEKNIPINRLTMLGRIAKNHEAWEEARHAFALIVLKDPNSLEGLEELTELAFVTGRYEDAKNWASRYFMQGGKDYLINYYYAEIFRREGKNEPALRYYEATLDNIPASEKSDIQMLTVKAQSSYYAGKSREAIALYQDMLARYPQDENIRADYAGILMDMKRFDEAQSIVQVKP